METLREKPKIADRLEKEFGVDYSSGNIIITYEGKIYCAGGFISEDLAIHEKTHIRQQSEIFDWWERYFRDPEFRMRQELEAYRNQYKFLKKTIKDRNQLFNKLTTLGIYLSSPMYGNIISVAEAIKLIKL